MTRTIIRSMLLSSVFLVAPALSHAEPRTPTVHDRTPRVHDRAPRPHDVHASRAA